MRPAISLSGLELGIERYDMRLDILDSYYIRARLSPCIIVVAPIALTLFLCFGDVFNMVSSTVVICILLALTNYIPVIQRVICAKKVHFVNYAALLLSPDNKEIDDISKRRYYSKLAKMDPSFEVFNHGGEQDSITACCESAVILLRTKTRDDHIVYEENISYGFCKNILLVKRLGMTLCVLMIITIVICSYCFFEDITSIPMKNWVALFLVVILLVFWLFGVNYRIVEISGKRYAKALIHAIDTLD